MNQFKEKYRIFSPKMKYGSLENIPTFYPVYNNEEKILGKINKNYENIQQNWLKGVTCIVVNEKGEILLERRVNKGLTPGKIDFVSGHLEDNETPEEGMKRELKEEMLIDVVKEKKEIEHLGKLPLIFISNGKQRKFFIDFYCLFRDTSNVVFQKDEIQEVFYSSIENTISMLKNQATKFPYNEHYEAILQKFYKIYEQKFTRKMQYYNEQEEIEKQ